MVKRFSVLLIILMFVSCTAFAAKDPGVEVYKKAHKSVGMILVEFTAEYMDQKEEAAISGTGFFFDEKKPYVLTNDHVIGIPDVLYVPYMFWMIEIKISNKRFTFIDHEGNKFPCKPIATCQKLDMAIAKVDIEKWEALKLGDPGRLEVGETVYALGAPLGLRNTFTKGIVSALKRELEGFSKAIGWIQTDCHINPGNSGGPLINSDGEVVGINTLSAGGNGVSGIYFAIPVDIFRVFPWFWKIIDKDEFPELGR